MSLLKVDRLGKACLSAFMVLSCLATPVQAEQGDRDQPIHVRADHNKIDLKTDKSFLSGNVSIVQGSMKILADELLLSQDADGNISAQGSGKPVRFKQKQDNSREWLEVEARRFDYEGKAGILRLFDEVVIRQGRDVSQASSAVFNLNAEVYEVSGVPGNQSLTILQPKKKADSMEGKSTP